MNQPLPVNYFSGRALLLLSEYHIRNLRWLLRMVYSGAAKDEKGFSLNNGDWCGELLWELEQFMADYKIDLTANDVAHQWPLQGHGRTDQTNRVPQMFPDRRRT